MNTLRINAVLLRSKLLCQQEDVFEADPLTAVKLMSNNLFQAALNALDPDAPCFVEDAAIQEVIYLGARQLVSQALGEAKAKVEQREVLARYHAR